MFVCVFAVAERSLNKKRCNVMASAGFQLSFYFFSILISPSYSTSYCASYAKNTSHNVCGLTEYLVKNSTL